MSANDYGDPMSERLLGIAADVLRSFGSGFGGQHLAIIGGAVPSLLVASAPEGIEAHVGTADLDLHLSLHLLDGESADYYCSIIDGLRSLGLAADREGDRDIKWRWVGRHRGAHIQVELLCPVRTRGGRPEAPADDTPAEANVGPNGEITALALGFGHLVADDVVWTLDALGPEAASAQIASSPLMDGSHADEVREQLRRLAQDQFRDANSVGPRQYATFLKAGDGGRRHAQGTVAALGQALSAQGAL